MTKTDKAINRTSFTDWNPTAELFAFSKRLSEDFKLPVLQQAFIHDTYIAQELEKQKDIGIENPTVEIQDNSHLIATGSDLLMKSVSNFVDEKLSSAPAPLKSAVTEHLLSDDSLAKLAKNLGAAELILSAAFPVDQKTLSNTFKAIVAALAESSGDERTTRFIRDFVCTKLSQLDWAELWTVEKPFEELQRQCAKQSLGEPEPRLIGSCGTNTLLASYNVAIYCEKKMIGSGFGETVDIAISQASTDALRGLFSIRSHQQCVKF